MKPNTSRIVVTPMLGFTKNVPSNRAAARRKGVGCGHYPFDSKRSGYRLSEQFKVIQVSVTDVMDNLPIDGLVTVHGNVSETHGLLHQF
jgi:hypothetical protein